MSGLQIVAFLSGLAGLGATIGATVSNEWRATSRASSVITATWILQGLWNNCAGNAIGALHCRPHHTILKLEGKLSSLRKLRLMADTSVMLAQKTENMAGSRSCCTIMWCKEKGNKFPIITRMCEVLRKEKVQLKKKIAWKHSVFQHRNVFRNTQNIFTVVSMMFQFIK